MTDVHETRVGLNPLVADADGDGLTNLEEFEFGIDPFNADSDGDGINEKLDNNPTVPDDSRVSALSSGIPLLWQDVNGDSESEWGLFGTSREDGRTMLLVKDAADKRGLVASYAWPGMDSPTLLTIPDISSDDTPELAAAGLNTNTNRYQLQIKDGADRGNTLSNITWSNRLSNVSFHVFNDMDGDGVPNVVVFRGEVMSF